MEGFSIRLFFHSQIDSPSVANLIFLTPVLWTVYQQFDVFIRNWFLVYSDFWHHCRSLEYLKTVGVLFSGQFICPKIWAKIA